MILPVLLLLASAAPVPFTPPPPLQVPGRPAVTPPEPRLPVQNLFSRDDYPAAADGRHVPVSVKLTIDGQGRVIGCVITRSSGNSELDRATCSILSRRERFTPALDAGSAPVIGNVDEMVDWKAVFDRR
jgi:protein TonB